MKVYSLLLILLFLSVACKKSENPVIPPGDTGTYENKLEYYYAMIDSALNRTNYVPSDTFTVKHFVSGLLSTKDRYINEKLVLVIKSSSGTILRNDTIAGQGHETMFPVFQLNSYGTFTGEGYVLKDNSLVLIATRKFVIN